MRIFPRPDQPTCQPRASVETLERRALLTLTVQIDYSLDTNNFFDAPEKRAILQSAANVAVERFDDELPAIVPGLGNTWKALLDHPGTGSNIEISNLTIPANTLLVYAGGRQMNSLGMGGPGGFSSSGTTAWNDLVATRGQQNARGDDATDFGPYGGSITFDTDPSGGWYFGTDPNAIAGRSDFFSVAVHEMVHLLGFGTSDGWESRVSGGQFTGPASVGEYDGAGNVPLSGDAAHWAGATQDGGRETAMDPDLTTGTRKELTALDLAGLDDLGWELPLSATLSSATSVTAPGATSATFNVTYSHYTNVDVSTLNTGDLMVSGPNGFNAPASLESISSPGKTVTATYSIGAPGGAFDGADSGSYSVSLLSQAVGDGFGNFAPAGSLGSFAVDIDSPPTASFSAGNVTQLGGATHTVTVTYTDSGGVDAASIDTNDVIATRGGDGLTLAVNSVSIDGSGNAPTRAATYVLSAPGGSWDPEDNGAYTVTLAADQVRDANGSAAASGALGTFNVSVGSLPFDAATPAVFTDASGDAVTISLRGPGSGLILFSDAGNADASNITLNGTTSASTLTINAAGAGTALGGLTVNGALKSFTARAADLAGTVSLSGFVPKILLRNAVGAIALAGSGGTSSVSLTLAAVRDLSVTSASAIKSIKAAEWLDTDATPDTVTTPSLSSLSVRGALQAGVTADTIGKISATGALSAAEIRAGSAIASVTATAFIDSTIFAGVRSDVSGLPDSLDDFANAAASIRSVTLKGKTATFSNTRIAAPSIGKAALGSASVGGAAGVTFGLATDRATSVIGSTNANGPYKLSKRQDPGTGLVLNDFGILIL